MPSTSDRGGLRLIHGGLDQPAVDNSAWYGAAAVTVVIIAVMALRIVQGGPPAPDSSAGTMSGFAESRIADVGAGDVSVIVAPGDTLWALAEALAPGRDPRPVVDILADRNGGAALRVGQRIVVPAEVLALDGRSSEVLLADGPADRPGE